MSKIVLLYLIIVILLLYVSKCEDINENNDIIKLKANNFDLLTSKPNTKWLIVFYERNCFLCQLTLNLIKETLIFEYKDDNKMKFGSVNCDDNFFLSLRFNITQIPYIVLIENEKIYQFKNTINKDEIINFINREKGEEDLFKITPIFNLVKVVHLAGITAYYSMKHSLYIMFKRLGINMKVNNYILICSLILLVLFALFIVEGFINVFEKKKKKSTKVKLKKDNNNETSNENNNTSTKEKIE